MRSVSSNGKLPCCALFRNNALRARDPGGSDSLAVWSIIPRVCDGQPSLIAAQPGLSSHYNINE